MVDKLMFFLPADKHKHFIPVDSTTLGVLARHAQSIQNKFTISLQYLKDSVKNEVDFLPADKQFLQGDTIILNLQDMPKLPKLTSLLFPNAILRFFAYR